MIPDYEKLYLLKDPFATLPIRLAPYDDAWLDRSEAVRLLQGEIYPRLPLKLRPAMGGKFVDFLWSTLTPIRVISEQLIDLFIVECFTGWSTYPIEVLDKGGNILTNYFGLGITGKAGGHDLRRVEPVEKPPIVQGGASYTILKGLYFEDDAWDGSDFSLMGHSISGIVTERVVQALKRAKIRNVRLIPLTIVEIPASVYEVRGLWPLNK